MEALLEVLVNVMSLAGASLLNLFVRIKMSDLSSAVSHHFSFSNLFAVVTWPVASYSTECLNPNKHKPILRVT